MDRIFFRRFAWAFLAWLLVVVAWGAYVRATGSGAGCGVHWPTCQGQLVPRDPALETAIEYSHRLSSGLALVGGLVLVLGAFRAFPRGHRVRRAAALSGLFLVLEALLGAGLVLFQLVARNASNARGAAMSLHLVNTFALLAFAALAARWAGDRTLEADGGVGRGRVRGLSWAALGAAVLLGVSGAIAALGDTLFPARDLAAGVAQDLSAQGHLFVRLRMVHPALAMGVGVLLLGVGWLATRVGAPVARDAVLLRLLVSIQLVFGAVNLALLAPVWAQLVHLALADLVWIALVLLADSWRVAPAGEALSLGIPASSR